MDPALVERLIKGAAGCFADTKTVSGDGPTTTASSGLLNSKFHPAKSPGSRNHHLKHLGTSWIQPESAATCLLPHLADTYLYVQDWKLVWGGYKISSGISVIRGLSSISPFFKVAMTSFSARVSFRTPSNLFPPPGLRFLDTFHP